jgi:hypothetical protein
MGKPECPTGYLALKRGCGHAQAVALTCKSPLCPVCEKARAQRVQRRWIPTLKTLPQLKLLTLTIANGPDLAERLSVLDRSFRRLLDIRIGRNNRRKIEREVAREIKHLIQAGSITSETGEAWSRSVARWLKAVDHAQEKRGRSFKLRALLKGLSSLEITYNKETGTWHAHRHLIISMPYLPQIVLSTLWRIATKNDGQIVDVRAIEDVETGVQEALKYVTKAWEIPDTGPDLFGKPDPQEELLKALKGKKRTWVLGRIKPVEQPKVCAGCGKEECSCERVATVSMNDQVAPGSFDVPGQPTLTRLHIYRDDKNRLTWTIERGEGVLSLYRPMYQDKERHEGLHDPPRRKRTFHSPDLTITIPPIQ